MNPWFGSVDSAHLPSAFARSIATWFPTRTTPKPGAVNTRTTGYRRASRRPLISDQAFAPARRHAPRRRSRRPADLLLEDVSPGGHVHPPGDRSHRRCRSPRRLFVSHLEEAFASPRVDRASWREYAAKSCQIERAATTVPSTMMGLEVTSAK